MSLLNSTQILVNSLHVPVLQQSKRSVLASSPVLDYLLPELSIWHSDEVRQQQELTKIDAYMLQETKQILNRVHALCFNLALSDTTQFNIELKPSMSNHVLQVTGVFAEKTQLTEQINADNWLTGAFNWLCPNYTALAHSQELLAFSYLYEKNRQQALLQYGHFNQSEQGIRCYLACRVEKGVPKLTWSVESPKTIYVLKALRG
ncbi:hypothetical protein [uncultured Paraglaciecola sp.]|uniref:hypothetical protein n=1 Tax=uncultured Paraglaciecola sp. TaxID=1765024 RepID=UPI002603B909|nr:hypothetical protein [uncultured Paraglaciecola sp.]